jgi:hypothetical protein
MSITSAAPIDWSTRPVPSALSAEKLAAWVDRSIVRTEGMLFTATPVEELDAIGRWQRLMDRAFAGLMREIVAAYNRASADEREFAADEVGLAVRATSTTGGNLVGQALAIAALPGLLEAVEAGVLTERHVLAVLRELDKVELTVEQRQCVVLVMLARYLDQTPGELAALVARLVVQVDRAAAAARDATATKGRKVWFSRDVDGQAVVLAGGRPRPSPRSAPRWRRRCRWTPMPVMSAAVRRASSTCSSTCSPAARERAGGPPRCWCPSASPRAASSSWPRSPASVRSCPPPPGTC